MADGLSTRPAFYLMETRIMAKMRYLPSSGTTRLVGGMISTTSRKNTWRLIRMDMDNVTCVTMQRKGGNGDVNCESYIIIYRRSVIPQSPQREGRNKEKGLAEFFLFQTRDKKTRKRSLFKK